MSFEDKLYFFLIKKYKKKKIDKKNLFNELNIDSLEYVKLINDIEKKFKKKFNPSKILSFNALSLKKFQSCFK